jgi:hypothetical protein
MDQDMSGVAGPAETFGTVGFVATEAGTVESADTVGTVAPAGSAPAT